MLLTLEEKLKIICAGLCLILLCGVLFTVGLWADDDNKLKQKEKQIKQANEVVEKLKKEQKKIRKKIKKCECGCGHIYTAKNIESKINSKDDNLYFYKGKIFKIEKVNIE